MKLACSAHPAGGTAGWAVTAGGKPLRRDKTHRFSFALTTNDKQGRLLFATGGGPAQVAHRPVCQNSRKTSGISSAASTTCRPSARPA